MKTEKGKSWIVIEQGKMGTYAEQLWSMIEAVDQAKERAMRKPGATFEVFEKIARIYYPASEPIVEMLSNQPSPLQALRTRYPEGHRYREGHLYKGIVFTALVIEIVTTHGKPMLKGQVRRRFYEWPFPDAMVTATPRAPSMPSLVRW